MLEGLTEKQKRFVEAYCGEAQGNATEAARLAGYSGNTGTLASMGHENLQKPDISRAIDEINGYVRSDAIASAEEVQAFLTGTMRGTECRSIVTTMTGPVLDADGKMVDAPAEPKDRVKAAEALAKMRGYVAPTKSEVEVSGVPAITVYIPSNGRDV